MKLACVRCKQRKTKCDRGEPTCHQCILAKADCQYVERRKRPRLAQQKVEVLSKRLELLERQMISGDGRDSSTPQDSIHDPDASPDPTPVPSPTVSLMAEDGQESWIYRMATDARQNFQANAQSQTPMDASTPHIESAMSTLNEALDDLGKLRIRPSVETPMNSLRLDAEEHKECIQSFLSMLDYLVIPDVFTSFLDWSVLNAIPNIVDSPFVKIDPVVSVMYWNAIHYGLDNLRGPGNKFAQAAYLKVLDNVPAWLDSATGSDIDAQIAGLTTWTAINNLDYQLSYKFHCKACHFLKIRGSDHLDLCFPKTHEEEERRVSIRYIYWQILSTDLLFRLFFGKPTILRWTPKKVKPPTIFSTKNMRPKAPQVILTVVWIQYTLMTAEMMSLLDKPPEERDADLPLKVNNFSVELEELVADWNLLSLMQDESIPIKLRYMIADHVMNILAVIIGVERVVREKDQDHPVNEITLRSARKVVDIILHFYASPVQPNETNETPSVFVLCGFISFYPFCAVFSLYEHILACANPDDCENDLQALENMGLAMQHACDLRSDFMPLSNTLNALNKVSRSFQDERRKKSHMAYTPSSSSNNSDTVKTPSQNNLLQQFQQQQGMNMPTTPMGPPSGLANPMFDVSAAGLPFFPGFSSDGDFQAQGFVRAVENDFIGKNWHEDWWDMGGMPVDNGAQTVQYNLPTPNS